MSLTQILVLAALAAAVLLLTSANNRLYPMFAIIAAGVEALIAFGMISLSVRGLSVWLVLAVTLLVVGALAWTKASGKTEITAATVLSMVGGLQLLTTLL